MTEYVIEILKVRELFDVCKTRDFYCEQREIKLLPNSVQNGSLQQVLHGLKNPSARRDCESRVKALKQKTDRNNVKLSYVDPVRFYVLAQLSSLFSLYCLFHVESHSDFQSYIPLSNNSHIHQDKYCFELSDIPLCFIIMLSSFMLGTYFHRTRKIHENRFHIFLWHCYFSSRW